MTAHDDILDDGGPARLRRETMVQGLVERGALVGTAWREAFLAVPRHQFVPELFMPEPDGTYVPLSAATDRTAWLDAVYADEPLVTQLDGRVAPGDVRTPVSGQATSSSSQPTLMALMLRYLDVAPGDQVLELGTGTGYNAALLAHRLGDEAVTSIEYDAALLAAATEYLAAAGLHPRLRLGDGGLGVPDGAPYTRVMTTCGFPGISPAWMQQCVPGGRILANVYRPLGTGILTALTVEGDGSARGSFLAEPGGFMPTRRYHGRVELDLLSEIDPGGMPKTRSTNVAVDQLVIDGFKFQVALFTDARMLTVHAEAGPQTWLLADDGAYACVEADGRVSEGGPRRLWAQVEEIHETWERLGRPPRDACGLSVTATGAHTVWCSSVSAWSRELHPV